MNAVLNGLRARSKVAPASIPAPTGGWNTRDSLDQMHPLDAVRLDNWYPGLGQVDVRDGYAEHGTGVGSGDVDTVIEYLSGGTRHLIAASATNLYNATASGAATSIGSSFSNGRWQGANFNGELHLVNGEDDPQSWDGSTLSEPSWSGTGLTVANLIGIHAFKNRLFFWEDDSQDFWYADLDAVTGTLTKFSLSRVGNFGGKLVAMGTWTHDGGDGVDDFAVFVMSSGEVIVYAGTDPGDASAWSLVGVYRIAEPLSSRSLVKHGGDLMIGTVMDYVNMSKVLRTGQVGQSSKLSGAIIDAVKSNKGSFGFQSFIHRGGQKAIFNVPNTDGTFDQHVINLLNGAPTRFRGIPARCWAETNGDLYFGGTGDGKVYKMTGNTDVGSAIEADGRQAWNAFGSPQRKRTTLVRPVVSADGSINYQFAVGFDFKAGVIGQATALSQDAAEWDTAVWDVAEWSPENNVNLDWRIFGGTGDNLSPRLRVSALQAVSWFRTDFRMEQGRNI